MSFIEIIIALIILVVIARYITYILSFFTIIPASLMGLLLFGIALDIVLFIIHRKN